MATTELDAPATTSNAMPTDFAVSAGSNRRAFLAVIHSHGSNAAPATTATMGGQSMNVLDTVDDDASTFDVCVTIFELLEAGIAAMSGTAVSVSGGTYNNRAAIYFSVQGATQTAITPAKETKTGTSGSVSLARVADSYTFGLTVQDFSGTAFSGLANPSGAAEFTVSNADMAYGNGTDSSQTVAFTWTHSTSRNNCTIVFNIAPAATNPTITSIDPDPAIVGSSLTITGTNFEASQGTGGVTLDGAGQTETAWADTSITITVALGNNRYGTQAMVVTNNSGNSSSSTNINVQPESTKSYVNLSGTLATSGLRITAIPDLVNTYQLEISGVVGGDISDVTVYEDASISVSAGVTGFYVRAHDGSTWGALGFQTISFGNQISGSVTDSVTSNVTSSV